MNNKKQYIKPRLIEPEPFPFAKQIITSSCLTRDEIIKLVKCAVMISVNNNTIEP